MIEIGPRENEKFECVFVYVYMYCNRDLFQNHEIIRIVPLFKSKLPEGSLYLLSLYANQLCLPSYVLALHCIHNRHSINIQ